MVDNGFIQISPQVGAVWVKVKIWSIFIIRQTGSNKHNMRILIPNLVSAISYIIISILKYFWKTASWVGDKSGFSYLTEMFSDGA